MTSVQSGHIYGDRKDRLWWSGAAGRGVGAEFFLGTTRICCSQMVVMVAPLVNILNTAELCPCTG